MPREIRYPFALGPDGSIAFVANPDQAVRQRVHALIGTEQGERVMLLDYGLDARAFLFEPNDDLQAETLAEMGRAQMEVYEPGIEIFDISREPSIYGDGEAKVSIQYARREDPSTSDALAKGTNVAIIGVGGNVDEVISA